MVPSHFYSLTIQILKNCSVLKVKKGRLPISHHFNYLYLLIKYFLSKKKDLKYVQLKNGKKNYEN